MGTITMVIGAYFKKEIHKYIMFKKYENEANHYIRWKLNKRISEYLNQ